MLVQEPRIGEDIRKTTGIATIESKITNHILQQTRHVFEHQTHGKSQIQFTRNELTVPQADSQEATSSSHESKLVGHSAEW